MTDRDDDSRRTTLQEEIRELARERDAVILAHNYQVPAVQDVADYVGDSLGLSRQAAATDAAAIVFCGVHFMAETAAILAPEKTVLIPDLDAGCSLAASITADQLREWKAQHPGAVVVSYVNTTAEVKAESDYCCTSGNAKAVIEAIPADREILFLPDMFLGLWLERVTGRKLHDLDGRVPRARRHPARGRRALGDRRPTPSCSSTPSAAARARRWRSRTAARTSSRPRAWSTSPSARRRSASSSRPRPGSSTASSKEAPGKRFEPVNENAICVFMKMITLKKVRDALRDWQFEVTVEPEIAARARGAIDRMVALG